MSSIKDPLATAWVDGVNSLATSVFESHADRDVEEVIRVFGAAVGGFLYDFSRNSGVHVADAFLEGFASFRMFLRERDEQRQQQQRVLPLLTPIKNKE